jgi:hypothetical protein
MILSGCSTTVRIPKHASHTTGLLDTFAEVLLNLRGSGMQIVGYDRMSLTDESSRQSAASANAQIRTAGLQAPNMDKEFNRFARHLKAEQPVAATLCIEEGLHS